MDHSNRQACRNSLWALAGALWVSSTWASTLNVVDNFTGATNTVNWYAYGALSAANSTLGIASAGACLTAGTTSSSSSGAASPSNAGQIPMCGSGSGGATGTIPDATGSGALRLTNNSAHQTGGIIYAGDSSGNAFPANTGINVTWTSYSYGGSGADGMTFFLLSSPQQLFTGNQPSRLGANGGSLGYSCSQNGSNPTDKTVTGRGMTGIHNGFLAIGMDEYGNFSNKNDATPTGNNGGTPNAIVIRGKGDLSNDTYPTMLSTVVSTACSTGLVLGTAQTLYPFYRLNGTSNGTYVLPSSAPLYTSATTRATAKPISYQLQITTNNLLTLKYSYNGGAWTTVTNPAVNITSISGALPSYLSFGFAASTGGSTNYHEITCFQAAPLTTSASSAGSNNQQTAQVQTGTQAYFAYYNANNWFGGVTSNSIVANSTTGVVSVSSTASWDSSCNLTGGACTTTGTTPVASPIPSTDLNSPANRTLVTWNGSAGAPFEWANLTSAQQTSLGSSNVLQFLRGDRSNEVGGSGTQAYRSRTSVMGDVINASPVWIGPPAQGYAATWSDYLNTSATQPENGSSATSYPSFTSTYATRPNVVYSGSNDGIMHGFRTGSYTSAGAYSTSTVANDGYEVMGYVPAAAISNLASYSNIIYSHQYFVDATPGTGDLFYSNNWHTWLVGGLGAGGQAIYALDVTNPATTTSTSSGNASETTAASQVVGEWNASNISCTYTNGSCGSDLGYTYGTPVVARFHNGKWGVIFGNGYNSSTGVAAIFVMMVDPSTGAKTFYEYSTGYGPSKDPTSNSSNNGIYYTTATDLDGDNITDYIYAGDLFGNVWRFDVTNTDPTKWAVSSYAGTKQPLFSTPTNGSGTSKSLQPITTKLIVGSISASATQPRLMVYFGTGQKIPMTTTSGNTYATGNQGFYGVWDWNMAGWNGVSSAQYASSTTPSGTLTTSSLVAQTIAGTSTSSSTTATNYAGTSNNAVCWAGTSACSSGNTQYGWKLVFPNSSSNEQLIYNPQSQLGAIVFNTTIPAANNVTSCTSSVDTGWSYALNPVNGGNFPKSFFANSSGNFSGVSNFMINAIQASAVGSFQSVGYNGSRYLVYQTSSGYVTGNIIGVNPGAAGQGNRLTWIELR